MAERPESSEQPRPTTGGDRMCPREFAARYQGAYRPLWCIAAAVLGDRTEADDVVQDAAVVALQRLDDFDPSTDFLAWTSKIVRFTALNRARLRARRRMASTELHAGSIAEHARSGRATAPPVGFNGRLLDDQRAFDDRLVRALGALDETARACLLLRTVLDMPFRQIAAVLEIPEGTAMSHVHRSRARLRETLDDAKQAATRTRAERAGPGEAVVGGES